LLAVIFCSRRLSASLPARGDRCLLFTLTNTLTLKFVSSRLDLSARLSSSEVGDFCHLMSAIFSSKFSQRHSSLPGLILDAGCDFSSNFSKALKPSRLTS
jgi:hypothetical protein